ncbi:putative siderophore transport system permease protein yfiZ precursor [Solibacillus isronensis B3W22]|uniref:Putative siderophore transport system permease protein yfiZ n=1 Tax=Solibacillus isronensis B3W22 TaxID=1224748 RepID=K1KXE2_9BACL|nr:iron ABC transporter permease [Solibacillus isronensis]AMO85389.1 iron ABC transporter [Solibacillus silvestris]EKB44582.1 putative siderophore transport system permease protein yfiZ precursor [Solibacillus isronensis B3W22]
MMKSNLSKVILLLFGFIMMIIGIVLSITYGYVNTNVHTTWEAFFHFNKSNEHIIILKHRLPRALIATFVGASLAIAGALLQTMTRNPLASPGILGINAGAGLFVVLAKSIFQMTSLFSFTLVAFLGAAVSALSILAISSIGHGEMMPMNLTLAGTALGALFYSITQGLLAINEAQLDQVLFWLAGSVQGRDLQMLWVVLPFFAIGWLITAIMAKQLNLLSLGEDVAKGLGLNVLRTKLLIVLIVVLLAGGSVAIAGPISFIGLIIPHIARKIIGTEHQWYIPLAALLGAILLLFADLGARYIIMPQEVPVGVMTAIIGTPIFVYIARKGFNKG